jgi:DNA-binding transcriptional regulator YbjK
VGEAAPPRAVKTRRARGERRREALLRAALTIIGQRGVQGATHREIAREADVPPATTTYYFSSLDELLEEALRLFVAEEIGRLGALQTALEREDAAPVVMAELFATVLTQAGEAADAAQLAQFELYLEAARRPSLRPVADECLAAYASLAEAALRAAGARRASEGARAFVAVVDGFTLQALAAPGRREHAAELREALQALFIAYAMDEDERARWEARFGG